MKWSLNYLPEAYKELKRMDKSSSIVVQKAIEKVLTNPVSIYSGGYGHPLSNKNGLNLNGFFKIKLKASGLRIVYQLIERNSCMLVVIIGVRADNEVYEEANKRIKKYEL